MKKKLSLLLALICLLALTACKKSMNSILSNEPHLIGTVTEVSDRAIMIENGDGPYWVSLEVKNKDSMTHFNIGDEVVVYYNGEIAESYPMQIHTVYAITLTEPADRSKNNVP